MATLSQLKDRIYRSTGHMYTDEFHMLDLLNDAVSAMVDGAKLRKKTTINAVVGTSVYALPADFKAPGILQDETNENYVIAYDLVDISENRYGYAIEAGSIYLKPSPLENKVLTHYYYKYAPSMVADSDIPTDIDTPYHNTIADYAIAMILPLLKDTPQNRIDRAWATWNTGLNAFIQSSTKKNKSVRSREKVVW